MSFVDAFSNAFKGRKDAAPDKSITGPTHVPGRGLGEAMKRAMTKQKSGSAPAQSPAASTASAKIVTGAVTMIEKMPPRDPDYLNKVKQLMSFKVVPINERSQVAEEFRILRTNIQTLDLPKKSLLFTSCHHSEGKTTSVLHLALFMAKSGKRVLLIDADLRRPKIAKLLRVRPRLDFADALKGADLKDTLVYSREQNLTVLMAKRQYSNATELFERPRFLEIIEEAHREFDFVLVDTCPILCAADPCIIGTQLGGCVLVIKTRSTQRESIQSSCEKMESSGIPIRGLLLTHVKLFVPKYLYRYQYYRGYYYYEDSQ